MSSVVGYYKNLLVEVSPFIGFLSSLKVKNCVQQLGKQIMHAGTVYTLQIDGNRGMDAVYESIRTAIDAVAAGKDPLEAFCQQVPEADECRVYE